MSKLIRDPLQADCPPLRVDRHGGLWPADPGQRPVTAPIGAEWDPLCEPWPALNPVVPPPASAAIDPSPGPAVVRSRVPSVAVDGKWPEEPGDDWRADRVPGAALVPKLVLPPEPRPARDVSPSRLSYRLNRLWLTPAVRHLVCQGVPVLLLIMALAVFWAGDARRAMVVGFFSDLRAAIEARPEFRIDRIEVLSETPEVAQGVLTRLDVALPASSLRLDLVALKTRIEVLDAVARAALQVRAGGILEIRVTERLPAMIWRHGVGLALVDAEGRRVALITDRFLRPDLPLIAGNGAPEAIAEARQLLDVAEPIRDRLAGLVRIGARRWDVVLDRDQRILLPANGAVSALERVLALDAAQGLLGRDVTRVDMRNPLRPTLRLSPEASEELVRIRHPDIRMANR